MYDKFRTTRIEGDITVDAFNRRLESFQSADKEPNNSMKVKARILCILLLCFMRSTALFSQKSLPDRYSEWQCAVLLVEAEDKAGHVSEGTGFFSDNEGSFITAFHVVNGATKITVVTSTGTRLKADLRFSDTAIKVAQQFDVLKLETHQKTSCFLKLGKSSSLRVGEALWGIGFPGHPVFTSDQVLYEGILSSRFHPPQCPQTCEFLRVQMPVTPGASGGPILNKAGEVVGVIDSVPLLQMAELKKLQNLEQSDSANRGITIGGVNAHHALALLSLVVYNYGSAGSAFAVPIERIQP